MVYFFKEAMILKVTKIRNVRTEQKEKLYSSLIIPSVVHSYSICIERMREWFLSKFQDDYFTSVNTEGAHSFDVLRGYDTDTIMKRKSPALSITPALDTTYNRDNLFLYQYGIGRALQNGLGDAAFFKDYKHNMFISVTFEELHLTFGYKMKLSTKAQQLDALKYVQIACRCGATECLTFDMDMHVPKHLMLQIASDAGFDVDPVNNAIASPIKFLEYLNQNSLMPFLYKLRCINGNNEFFVRVPQARIHLSIPEDISVDDGERNDQLTKDYGIDFTVDVHMMAPQFYTYHSRVQHTIVERGGLIEGNDNVYMLNSIKLPDLENFDEHGWNKYMETEYEEEMDKPLDINIYELFEGSDIDDIIKITLQSGLSPAIFLNFKVYNDGYQKELDVDYRNLIIHVNGKMTSCISHIVIYANLEYINEQLTILKNMNSGRTS
jgi:hypothetical protein